MILGKSLIGNAVKEVRHTSCPTFASFPPLLSSVDSHKTRLLFEGIVAPLVGDVCSSRTERPTREQVKGPFEGQYFWPSIFTLRTKRQNVLRFCKLFSKSSTSLPVQLPCCQGTLHWRNLNIENSQPNLTVRIISSLGIL